MGEVVGSRFIINKGENPDLQFPVVDSAGDAYDLSGGKSVLSYTSSSGVTVDKDLTIATTTVTASFDSATIKAMSGIYTFELWCRNSAGKIVMTKTGLIDIHETKSPDAVAP